MSPLSRRAVIDAVIPLASVGVPGCLSFPSNECDSDRAAVIRTKQISLSSEELDDVDPIVFDELPETEQEIVRTAIEEEEYRKCPAADPFIPEPLQSFTRRVSEHKTEKSHVFLKFDGNYCAVAVRIEDGVYTFMPDC